MTLTLSRADWARPIALGAWIGLLVLCVGWELWLAPLRPGGSWLVLKALPLLLPLRGMLAARPRALQIAVLIVLLYLAEAAVRLFEPPPSRYLALVELALVLVFFTAAIRHLRHWRSRA